MFKKAPVNPRQAIAEVLSEKDRAKGTPSGRVGSSGFVPRAPYIGSAVDKSTSTVNQRRQTGTKPTHNGQGDQNAC